MIILRYIKSFWRATDRQTDRQTGGQIWYSIAVLC